MNLCVEMEREEGMGWREKLWIREYTRLELEKDNQKKMGSYRNFKEIMDQDLCRNLGCGGIVNL